MAQGFDMELRSQREFGWLFAAWLLLSGAGSGLFLLYAAYGLAGEYAWLSLAAIAAGGLALSLELGNPLRAWRGVARLRTSWLSRGALSVGLFLACGVLYLAPRLPGLGWLDFGPAVSGTLKAVALLAALVVTLYPGFFLSQNRSIPFWNTALVPLASFGFALLGAAGLVLVVPGWAGAAAPGLDVLAEILIVVNLALVGAHLYAMSRAGGAGAESVRRLHRAPLGWLLYLGVVALGLVLPLAALAAQAAPLAGAGILIGALAYRYCVLAAGVYVPAGLVPQGMDLSRIKRPSAELQREYAAMAAQRAGGG